MNPPQGEVVLMATTSQPNQETQDLIRLFHQIKKTLPILRYNYLPDKSIKPVLNAFAGYEPNHENPLFSINDTKNVTAS